MICPENSSSMELTHASGSAARPNVSIVIASYGRLPFLQLSVESALLQTYPNFEVLVVDDGSDEQTRLWLRTAEALHKGLRVVFQNHDGVAVARARGVSEARGQFICILDSDDTIVPHALSRLVDVIESDINNVIVYANIREHRPNGVVHMQKYHSFKTASSMLLATLMSPRVPFKHSGTMFRRDVAIKLGSYDKNLTSKVDIDLYLKFLNSGYMPKLVSEPLVDFRMHEDSVSRNRLKGLSIWFILIDRYGPKNVIVRSIIKMTRAGSEIFKRVYLDITS